MWEQQPLNFKKCPLASSCVVLQYFVVVVGGGVAGGWDGWGSWDHSTKSNP